jgi:hypothetical protein
MVLVSLGGIMFFLMSLERIIVIGLIFLNLDLNSNLFLYSNCTLFSFNKVLSHWIFLIKVFNEAVGQSYLVCIIITLDFVLVPPSILVGCAKVPT